MAPGLACPNAWMRPHAFGFQQSRRFKENHSLAGSLRRLRGRELAGRRCLRARPTAGIRVESVAAGSISSRSQRRVAPATRRGGAVPRRRTSAAVAHFPPAPLHAASAVASCRRPGFTAKRAKAAPRGVAGIPTASERDPLGPCGASDLRQFREQPRRNHSPFLGASPGFEKATANSER